MSKILGVGGVFFKSQDPDKLKQWYKDTLGIDSNEFAGIFSWESQKNVKGGMTLWAPFKKDTNYFIPSEKEFMINFVVDSRDDFISTLEKKGIEILAQMDEPQGKFAHIMDIEGNKIELWEPA